MFPLKMQWIEGIKKATKAAAISCGVQGEEPGRERRNKSHPPRWHTLRLLLNIKPVLKPEAKLKRPGFRCFSKGEPIVVR